MNTNPTWITYFTALLTPTIALLGIMIAYFQWRLAQNKLKLELFARRFSVYEATRNLIGSIAISGKVTDEQLSQFLVATREAKWLLNDSIAQYLSEHLHNIVLDLQEINSELEGIPRGEIRTDKVKKSTSIKKLLLEQNSVIDKKISPFLQLRH